MTRNFRNAHSLQQQKIGEIGYDGKNRRANIRLNQEDKNPIEKVMENLGIIYSGFKKIGEGTLDLGSYIEFYKALLETSTWIFFLIVLGFLLLKIFN